MGWFSFSDRNRRKGERSRPESRSAPWRSRGGNSAWARRLTALLLALTTLAALGLLAALGARAAGRALITHNELFRVRDIRVECSGDAITPRHILDYTRLADLNFLFATNIETVRRHLLAEVPRLKSVDIVRRLPGELVVRVRERTAVARLEVQPYFLTIDREGVVLGGAGQGSRTLPTIRGHALPGIRPGIRLSEPSIRNALAILEVCQTTPIGLRVHVADIDVRDPAALGLRLREGEQVRLAWPHMGEPSALAREQLEHKLGRLQESLVSAAARGKRIASMDMTLDNNFPAQEY